MKVVTALGSFKRLPRAELAYAAARHRASRGVSAPPSGCVLSLTSYPARIRLVHRTITSLLAQTITPEVIYLALAEAEFPQETASLPRSLRELIDRAAGRVQVEYVDSNTRSYKKLLPAVARFGHDRPIVTVDDDVLYPRNFLEMLAAGSAQHPRSTVGTRGVRIQAEDDGTLAPYLTWPQAAIGRSSRSTLLTGRGGILYPAHSLVGLEADATFERLAPSADDIWFKALTTSNGFDSVRVGTGKEFPDSGASQVAALHRVNVTAPGITSENELSMVRAMKHFGVPLQDVTKEHPGD